MSRGRPVPGRRTPASRTAQPDRPGFPGLPSRFEIRESLGEGSQKRVYRAHDGVRLRAGFRETRAAQVGVGVIPAAATRSC